ncbi:MAG: methylase protein, partial [Candidatus Jorgensenbacteria bacterium GW2011_GWC1_48_8]
MPTLRQEQIIRFMREYSSKHDVPPSIEEMARHFRRSVSTIHEHLQNLRGAGRLEKLPGRARSLSVREIEPMVQIPLLGTIAAGRPVETYEGTKETIAVPQTKIPKNGEVYALRVAGESMIEENILDGDIILVKQQGFAENGQKIVALIDNYETTLKTFYKERNQIRLQPANKNFEPIIVRKNREFAIQGVVLDVIKSPEKGFQEISLQRPTVDRKYKRLPLNQIICGDAVEELRKLPDNSCDVIIVDPPYNIGKDFGNNTDKRELNEYVNWCKSWINESVRVMKPTATLFIYGFSEILAYLSVEIPINKRWLIWHYTNKNVASLNFWQRSHEAIVCAWKNKPIFNKDEVREPYTEGFLNGAAGKIRKGTPGRFSKNGKETIYKFHKNGALPRDVIKTAALAGGAGMVERWFLCKTCNDVFEPQKLQEHSKHNVIKHPTQKPLELTRKLIKSSAPEKEGVILIPFVGSGSECVAVKELDQNYIGFEINPDYVNLAEKWLNK